MKIHELALLWIPFLIISWSMGPINEQQSQPKHQPQSQPGSQPQVEEAEFSYKINEQTDVINIHAIIVKNRDKLDEFVNKSKGAQRVIHYTFEGDPIYRDLTYTNNKIQMRYDTTKDRFGSPQVITHTCGKLERNETDTFLAYSLTDCDGDRKEVEVLRIQYDVEKQDYFEFIFKYGDGAARNNVINTIDYKVVKAIPGAESVQIRDFKLTKEERQLIYKQMVLANYLDDKQLSNQCAKEAFVSYDLDIKINSGTRHHQWSTCDQSIHGIQMTKLAEQIIQVVDANLKQTK